MPWKKAQGETSKYIKLKAGDAIEGVYGGYEERENPFYDKESVHSSKTIYDYKILIDDAEKILSSTAGTLKEQLIPLPTITKIRIEFVQKGIKKWYQVYISE